MFQRLDAATETSSNVSTDFRNKAKSIWMI